MSPDRLRRRLRLGLRAKLILSFVAIVALSFMVVISSSTYFVRRVYANEQKSRIVVITNDLVESAFNGTLS